MQRVEQRGGSGRKRTARTNEIIDAVKELVLSQEDAPAAEIHRTVRHFEHKNNIIVNLAFLLLLLILLLPKY